MKVNYWIFSTLLILFFACDTKEVKRDRFFLQGNTALDEREYSQAITHYTNALTIDPDFALAYNNRGVAKMENGRSFEAIQDYNQAILIDLYYWDAIVNRANAYEVTHQYAKSLKDLVILEKQFPDSLQYLFIKGIVLTHLDSLESAAAAFEQVWDQDGTNVEALINLANVRYYQKRYDEAIKLLEDAKQIDPSQANIYNTLNQIYNENDSYELALEVINEAIKIDLSNPIYMNNRGYTYLMIDSLDRAIADINASLVRDPENMWAFRNKGIYFLKAGDLAQAERYLTQATEAEPPVPMAYTYLSAVLELAGRKEEARAVRMKEPSSHHH